MAPVWHSSLFDYIWMNYTGVTTRYGNRTPQGRQAGGQHGQRQGPRVAAMSKEEFGIGKQVTAVAQTGQRERPPVQSLLPRLGCGIGGEWQGTNLGHWLRARYR